MQIYPAIDIKDGNCVRLVQGDYAQKTIYFNDPTEPAMMWEQMGATFLHIVDLDGAKLGTGYNNEAIKRIRDSINIPIQVGGGIRTMDDIESKISIGMDRVIIGTKAVSDKAFIKEAVKKYGDKIAVGIDAKNGMVAVSGWLDVTDIKATELCSEMAELGVKTIIYTDIAKDGMMQGVNIEQTHDIIKCVEGKTDIIASGGVSCMADLMPVQQIGSSGVIIGKALYLNKIDLREAIEIFQK